MNRIIPAAILTLFTTLCFGQLAYAKETAQTSQPAAGAATEQAVASTPGLADLVLKASELSNRLTDLEESLEEVFDSSAAESSFRSAEERLSDLSSRLKELKTEKTTGYYQLIQLKTALQQERDFLETNLEPVTASLRQVSALRKEWSKEKKQWAQWQASPDEDLQIPAVQSTFARAQETISKARTAISQHLEPLLAAEIKGGDLQARTYSLVSEMNDLISDRQGVVSTESSPPMLSSRYFAQFALGLGHELRQGIRAVTFPDRQFFARQGWVILLQVLLAVALAAVILRSRSSLEKSEQFSSLAKRPFALGVAVSVATLSALYALSTNMAFVREGFWVDRPCSRGWSLHEQIHAQMAHLWAGFHHDHYPVITRFEPATAAFPAVRLRRCPGWPYPLPVARSAESSSKGLALVHLRAGPWKSVSHDCSTCGGERAGRLGLGAPGLLAQYVGLCPGSLAVNASRTGRFGLGCLQISPSKNIGFPQPRLKHRR